MVEPVVSTGEFGPTRVPSADETAESVRRAQRALCELKQRQALEVRHTEEDARDEADRRHIDLGQDLNSKELLSGSTSDGVTR
jgi:hypothetical protein